jgi:hypothetical protein
MSPKVSYFMVQAGSDSGYFFEKKKPWIYFPGFSALMCLTN